MREAGNWLRGTLRGPGNTGSGEGEGPAFGEGEAGRVGRWPEGLSQCAPGVLAPPAGLLLVAMRG